MTNPNLPGRLGNPNKTLGTDERADPRIIQALAAVGGLESAPTPVDGNSSYEDCLAYCLEFEQGSALMHPQQLAAMPDFPFVVSSTEVIKGVDDNDITLHVHVPVTRAGPTPCVVHTHGGGMVLMTAADPIFTRWRNTLAETGLVVIGVEFRNGGGSLGNHPFPAGLNDCAAAIQWVNANKARLGISTITITGESGGGNLAIATTLKASQEGWLDHINGVYAQCPYISNAYADPSESLLSLRENDGYLLNCRMMSAMSKVYDPSGENATNPLAWPLHADQEMLKDLPPHAITVNELDPLRDEGLAYYRKLLAAGVSVTARTINGTTHAGDQSYPDIAPDNYRISVNALANFAKDL